MKKTVLIFGLISGAISAGMVLATIRWAEKAGLNKGEVIGYTAIVIQRFWCFLAFSPAGKMFRADG